MSVLRRLGRRRLLASALSAILILGGLGIARSGLGPASASPIEAALRTASTLALTTGARVNARIEQVRDPAITSMSRVDLDLRIGRAEADRTLDPFLAEPSPAFPSLLWENDFELRPTPAGQLAVRRQATSDGTGDLWGSGLIEFGRTGDGMLASAYSRADLATGMDLSITKEVSAGLAAGLNRARDDAVGTLDLPTVSAYGTLAPSLASYFDIVAGLGPLHATARPTDSPFDTGTAGFATATYGTRYRLGQMTVSPYGRLETVLVHASLLDPDPVNRTISVLVSRTSAVAGFRTSRPIHRTDFVLAPALRFEMRQELARARPLGQLTSRHFLIAPEIAAEFAPHWTARIEHSSRFDGDHATRSLQMRLEARF